MISLKVAQKINCGNCKFSIDNKCPIRQNEEFCFPYFIKSLYEGSFEKFEIQQIESMFKSLEAFDKEASSDNIVQIYNSCLYASDINKNLKNPKEITLYAFSDLIMMRFMPNSMKLGAGKIEKINEIVPYFKEKYNKVKKIAFDSFVNNRYSKVG